MIHKHRIPAPAALALAIALSLSSCAYFVEERGSRALAVGIDAYAYGEDLHYCVADAEAIAIELSESGYSVTRLQGTLAVGATPRKLIYKADLLSELSLAAAAAPSGGWDSFVFYYAGHGYDPTGNLAMSPLTTTEQITPDELLSAVAAVPAKVRAVILDSCNSGNFVDESPTVSPYPDDYTGTKLYSYPFSLALIEDAAAAFSGGADGDLIVLSAAGAGEPSQESGSYGHGIFTAGLLEAVKKGDANKDGLVTLTEAYDHAADFIRTKWNMLYPESSAVYLPRLSGNALDVVLFK